MKRMILAAATLAVLTSGAVEITADFSTATAKFRPALHSASYGAMYERAHQAHLDNLVREMNLEYVRTHDLALCNHGSRIFDNHFIFPLQHLDPTKAENYYFAQTDFMMRLQQNIGLKVFWRLGTSIEHTGLTHFNAEIPANFEAVAEQFAGTIRHYTRGWANGMTNAVEYWEIWNEPDGNNNMWSFNGGVNDKAENNRNDERRELFVKFFVTVLKRLKSEFPDLKIGGPALCTMREDWFRPILRACKKEGLRPDFLSWHCYADNPDRMFNMLAPAEKMCEEEGFPGLEFIINEWHYIPQAGWNKNAATRAPDDMNGINSACFTLTVLSRLQTSRYDQAFFYGWNVASSSWGYLNYNTQKPNKNFYALKTFGRIKKDAAWICPSTSSSPSVTAFAAKSADGHHGHLLVSDFFGRDRRLTVTLKGAEKAKVVSAKVLSFDQDLEDVTVNVKNGRFTLVKPDAYSAAFWVTFEL